jgi:glycosyltransferase involved in cell wall biosynthesis
MRPIRVLYVMQCLDVGGAERSLMELLARLPRDRVEPIVCTLQSGGVLAPRCRDLGIKVVELGVAPGPRQLLGAGVLAVMAKIRPDVVHARLVVPNVWARLGAALGIPVITEERGLSVGLPNVLVVANRWTARFSHVCVGNSKAVVAMMHTRDGIPEARTRLVYGGVDTTRVLPRTGPRASVDGGPVRPTVVCVARLEENKGVADLLDAWREVSAAAPLARLRLVGGGALADSLARFARTHGLTESVHFAGEQKSVLPFLHDADVFVLPSHEEGLSNALLEGMAAGLPAVATRVGGNPELVEDGVSGILVPSREPRALGQALRVYLEDAERAARDGAAGRRRVVEHFSFDAVVASYLSLYDEVLGSRGPRR